MKRVHFHQSNRSFTTHLGARRLIAGLFSIAAAGPAAIALAEDDETPFAEAHLFFELNDTDGDLGIHALIDGDPWRRLKLEDPRERRMLGITVMGRLRRQGLTEIFFESAEPPFESDDPDEVTLLPEDFFRRFPPGTYEVEGRTLDHRELESELELTHVMPAPPEVEVNGTPMAEECDEEEDDYDAPVVVAPVVISWDPVTLSHPDPDGGGAGVQPPVAVEIHNYEIVVEIELEIDGEEFTSVMHAVLPPDLTSFAIPDDFLGQGDTFKYEVLAREESYNQTAVESCFLLADAGD